MTRYVALLRGIAPVNPAMRNDRLRSVAESLGFTDVRAVISSGNLVFTADPAPVERLEQALERAWPEQLGFESTSIVLTRDDLADIAEHHPFGDRRHGPASYLTVTFTKGLPSADVPLPHTSPDGAYTVLGTRGRAIFATTDTTAAKTPDLMGWLERQYGKGITTRTMKTVERLLA